MTIKTPWLIFTTKWSSDRRPYFARCSWWASGMPQAETVGWSFMGCAVVKRRWWNHWTDNGRLTA